MENQRQPWPIPQGSLELELAFGMCRVGLGQSGLYASASISHWKGWGEVVFRNWSSLWRLPADDAPSNQRTRPFVEGMPQATLLYFVHPLSWLFSSFHGGGTSYFFFFPSSFSYQFWFQNFIMVRIKEYKAIKIRLFGFFKLILIKNSPQPLPWPDSRIGDL